jgi:thiol-activated cytolysin
VSPNLITKGGNYTKDSPGAALSYKLRYLKDNSVTNVILASEYNVRQCQKVFSKYEVKLERIICYNGDGDNTEAELFGYIAVTSPDQYPIPCGILMKNIIRAVKF